MRKALLMILLAVVSSNAAAKQSVADDSQTFLCVGSMPIYEEGWILKTPISDNDRTEWLIKINKKAQSISFNLPHTGPVVASLQVSDEFYSGVSPVKKAILGAFINQVIVSINRFTGSTLIGYQKPDENIRAAFHGYCKPATAKF